MRLPRLYLLPGLAANHRLFGPQAAALPVEVPAWIAPEPRERLEAYAARMARALPQDEPYLLGGFSFGGQVAQEMVRHLARRPAALVLICGVRGRQHIRADFRMQVKLQSLFPAAWQRPFYAPFARWFARRDGLDDAQAEVLARMAQEIEPGFLRWSAVASAGWEGRPDLRGVPIRHIHGARDPVIPDLRREAELRLEGAGHLITLTRPAEVNAWLEGILREYAPRPADAE